MPPHHSAPFANGYPRGNTFEISPHSYTANGFDISNRLAWLTLLFQIPTSVVRRRAPPPSRPFDKNPAWHHWDSRIWGYFIWPRGSVASVISLGILSTAGDPQLESVRYYDLSNVQGTARGWEREERILFCVPLRDAQAHLPMFFSHLRNFTYPHHLIDLAFLGLRFQKTRRSICSPRP